MFSIPYIHFANLLILPDKLLRGINTHVKETFVKKWFCLLCYKKELGPKKKCFFFLGQTPFQKGSIYRESKEEIKLSPFEKTSENLPSAFLPLKKIHKHKIYSIFLREFLKQKVALLASESLPMGPYSALNNM